MHWLRRLKTYLRGTMGRQRISNITLINFEREYVNSVVNNDIDRIIDSLAVEMAETAISFNVFYELKCDRFICKSTFTSDVGLC